MRGFLGWFALGALALLVAGCAAFLPPQIEGVYPNKAAVATEVTVRGHGFGSTPGTVSIGGQAGEVLGWTDVAIRVRIPVIETPGGDPRNAPVIVIAATGAIGPFDFTVVRGILFASNRFGNFEIMVMNLDGSGTTNLTRHPSTDARPSWSPDGTKVAFVSDRTGNGDVYTMNADGTGLVRLTDGPELEGAPSWSPDGERIAFHRFLSDHFEIWVMDSDGSDRAPLLVGELIGTAPSWSPDGTKIAYHSAITGYDDILVYTFVPGGFTLTNLTTGTSSAEAAPVWSPDGSRIAFQSDRDGNVEIYVMNAMGENLTRLTNNPAIDEFPTWSPDGHQIVFDSNRGGTFELYSITLGTLVTVQLTHEAGADDGQPAWNN